ncbi:MAG TPA: hypothetical protein VIX18_04720 [Nitrospirota bacterium]
MTGAAGKRILKILLGLLLVPFCTGFTWQLTTLLASTVYRPNAPYYFLAGWLAYATVHILFRKPIFTYVVGHELTHALFAMLFGGSVKSFQASERGGRVTLTKSNFLITLAPYFFPVYTFAALALYGIVRATGAGGGLTDALIFLSGATFAFHVILTFMFLRTDQNDIREEGAVFSYPLIYLFNIAFAALLVNICLSENTDYLRFLVGGIMKTVTVTTVLFHQADTLFHAMR